MAGGTVRVDKKVKVGLWASIEGEGWMSRIAEMDITVAESLPDPVNTDSGELQAYWAQRVHDAVAREYDLPCDTGL